ncbi:endo-beta-1,3-glucanase [Arthroderma uncinatum]|uniref:endo-beta-1,3-glucanase n=1 Tax=Arthroderma uncinatum TaxID=74035 RepID=UPI00144A9C78|nr:endo-beta-1,3-glucanase [Arthroderma uncinatum]KAF3479734.1 endo-beta-1,3-glucanase [Arthroderma uncinatum]
MSHYHNQPYYRNPSPEPEQDLAMMPPQNNYYSPVNPSMQRQPDMSYNQMRDNGYDDLHYPDQHYIPHNPATQSDVTAGADNYGHGAAGGGMTGLASGVAYSRSRRQLHDSRAYEEMGYQETMRGGYDPGYDHGHGHGYGQRDMPRDMPRDIRDDRDMHRDDRDMHGIGQGDMGDRYNGNGGGYSAYQAPVGALTPGHSSPHYSGSERSIPSQGQSQYPNQHQQQHHNPNGGPVRYHYEDPYRRDESGLGAVHPESINPHNIVDDGDDGFIPEPKRRSILSIGQNSSHNNLFAGAVPVAGAGTGAGTRSPPGGGGAGGEYNLATGEKKVFADEERSRKKRLWIIGVIVAIVIIGAIAGGVTAGILANKSSSEPNKSGGTPKSGEDDTKLNGDLGKNSPEIKKLQNENLHKVFPGMDYTPWGTQYPLCLKYPPSQNNVTRDIAVLAQLTNTVRLYGTDCNQTEMVLHAFERLELKQMKLWLGVWIDTNTTTNDRQIKQLYEILEKTEDKSVFKGVIVGNEVLYRGKNDPSTITKLMKYITGVRQELDSLNLKLPIATSDLGDAWTKPLTKIVDVVMSNVHPFFAGVTAKEGTSWAWSFWDSHDVVLTQGTDKVQVISEIGWPSAGGNNCGEDKCADSTSGSVASIKEMNTFMEGWICEALKNGTNYFWFEAFDEPWKIVYNTPGKEWEDKWGLMDPGRNLKPGVKIPDCGGKTID